MKETINFIINGRSGAGKTEIAYYLQENHKLMEITFADGIYEIAQIYFGMTKKNRKLLQSIGQSLREIDEDVWVNRAKSMIDSVYHSVLIDLYNGFVIPDCRQKNEYELMTEGFFLDFIPIKVEASLENRIKRIEKRDGIVIDDDYIDRMENHKAETGADDCEYMFTLNNDGSKEDLYKQIDEMIKIVEGSRFDKGDKKTATG